MFSHRLRSLLAGWTGERKVCLRLRKESGSSKRRWLPLCGRPSLFIVGRERAKLGYFWRHANRIPRSGPYLGCVVNSDTGMTVFVDDRRLTIAEFEKVKIAETIGIREGKSCRPFHSPLWQADSEKIRRMAPIEFIVCYMPDGSITPFAMKSTNSPATPPKAMLSAPWHRVQTGSWG
jgi:hypothetical protein